jgi:hypothetical protein
MALTQLVVLYRPSTLMSDALTSPLINLATRHYSQSHILPQPKRFAG